MTTPTLTAYINDLDAKRIEYVTHIGELNEKIAGLERQRDVETAWHAATCEALEGARKLVGTDEVAAMPAAPKVRAKRRSKAEMEAARAKTTQAATDAGLIAATPPVRNVAAPDDEMPDIPANLKRA
jgi:hypothetical protein